MFFAAATSVSLLPFHRCSPTSAPTLRSKQIGHPPLSQTPTPSSPPAAPSSCDRRTPRSSPLAPTRTHTSPPALPREIFSPAVSFCIRTLSFHNRPSSVVFRSVIQNRVPTRQFGQSGVYFTKASPRQECKLEIFKEPKPRRKENLIDVFGTYQRPYSGGIVSFMPSARYFDRA